MEPAFYLTIFYVSENAETPCFGWEHSRYFLNLYHILRFVLLNTKVWKYFLHVINGYELAFNFQKTYINLSLLAIIKFFKFEITSTLIIFFDYFSLPEISFSTLRTLFLSLETKFHFLTMSWVLSSLKRSNDNVILHLCNWRIASRTIIAIRKPVILFWNNQLKLLEHILLINFDSGFIPEFLFIW